MIRLRSFLRVRWSDLLDHDYGIAINPPPRCKEATPMTESKPWYMSTGVIGGIVAAIAGVLSFAGYQAGPEHVSEATVAITQIIAGIGGVVAVWGRVKATKSIGDPNSLGGRIRTVLAVAMLAPVLLANTGCVTADSKPVPRSSAQEDSGSWTEAPSNQRVSLVDLSGNAERVSSLGKDEYGVAVNFTISELEANEQLAKLIAATDGLPEGGEARRAALLALAAKNGLLRSDGPIAINFFGSITQTVSNSAGAEASRDGSGAAGTTAGVGDTAQSPTGPETNADLDLNAPGGGVELPGGTE